MRTLRCISRWGVLLLALGYATASAAQAGPLEGPAAIRIVPLSPQDMIAPRIGARLSDADGLQLTDGNAVIAPFTLRAVIGADSVEVSVPELRVDQLLWVAEPLGCVDDDPKTKCYPTWGAEYSGQSAVDVPVYVEVGSGGIAYSDYGVISLFLNVTVVDGKVRDIVGSVQITYSTESGLPNYRIPVVGKLR